MCLKRNSVRCLIYLEGKPKWIRIDPCIKHLIPLLNLHDIHTVACCCGHRRYPLTIVCKNNARVKNNYFELISGIDLPRTRNFYVKDSDGFYYIPETIK